MNKFAKGSLAAGAGLVLLLGGAGTLAYWNSDAELAGGTINAGTLELTADETAFQESNLVQWVPGDQHTYSTTLTLTTEGDNIQGDIVLDESTIISSSGVGTGPFVVDLSMDAAGPSDKGGVVNFDDATDTITFDGDGTYTIPVKVTVSLPFEGGEEPNDSQSASLDLTKVVFTATQTQTSQNVEE